MRDLARNASLSRPRIARGTAVITIVRGRHGHLLAQFAGLDAGRNVPELRIVVAMGDPGIPESIRTRDDTVVLDIGVDDNELPLGRARNLGANSALRRGLSTLIFLDVDCIPGRELVDRYTAVASDARWDGALLSGAVTYLQPAPAGGYNLADLGALSDPHPARPHPVNAEVVAGEDTALFWSLSFAVSADTWQRIGGFDTDFTGYGGEDTDFAFTARSRGVPLAWVGGAEAFHQYHPVSSPPVEHWADILRNAAYFRAKWGWWPMETWLRQFVELGLISVVGDEFSALDPASGNARVATA